MSVMQLLVLSRQLPRTFAVVVTWCVLAACGSSRQAASELNADSAHAKVYDAVVPNGFILTRATDDATRLAEIKAQLLYATGQLNGMNGGPSFHSLAIKLGTETAADEGLSRVSYEASFGVAWPREQWTPKTYVLKLPARADSEGIYDFFQAFAFDNQKRRLCVDWQATAVPLGELWYYYRPEAPSCPLREGHSGKNSPQVAKIEMRLTPSAVASNDKAPEYDEIWRDGKLNVVAIFGKLEPGSTLAADAGVKSYVEFYAGLVAKYGKPVQSTLGNAAPGLGRAYYDATFKTERGGLEVHSYLVDDLMTVPSAIQSGILLHSSQADLVTFNAHSSLGSNVRLLSGLVDFARGKYQIYFVNGCDTFAYNDDSLSQASQRVNPDAAPTKYLDVIVNAMPTYFHKATPTNLAMIAHLITSKATYRALLGSIDAYQKAIVLGEEDNAWPKPF